MRASVKHTDAYSLLQQARLIAGRVLEERHNRADRNALDRVAAAGLMSGGGSETNYEKRGRTGYV